MDFIVLLVVLGGFGWLAVWTDRRIQTRKQAQLEAAVATPSSETKPALGWRLPWQQSQPSTEVQAVRAWAVATFTDQPDLQQWLASLSDDAMCLLTAKLADFCTDMGFPFEWLLTQKVDQDEALATHLRAIATQYIAACYHAYLLQDDMTVFQTWQEFTDHPYRKPQQVLAQRLLVQLLAQGLTPPAAQSLLIAPEKEREIYVVQAVREAAEKHPIAFRSVLKTALNTPADPALAPETITSRLLRGWRHPTNGAQPMETGRPTASAS